MIVVFHLKFSHLDDDVRVGGERVVLIVQWDVINHRVVQVTSERHQLQTDRKSDRQTGSRCCSLISDIMEMVTDLVAKETGRCHPRQHLLVGVAR